MKIIDFFSIPICVVALVSIPVLGQNFKNVVAIPISVIACVSKN